MPMTGKGVLLKRLSCEEIKISFFETELMRKFIFTILYLIPIFLVIYFIAIFGVNTPFWDEWGLIYLFDKVATGTVSFLDFFNQHNEHRIIFPKIIFISLAFISKWNLKVEMFFSVFLSVLALLFLYKISENTQGNHKFYFHLFNVLSCFFIFSLAQWENWLWGFQLSWFLVNTCLVSAVFTLTVPSKISPNLKLCFSALWCFIASFSLAHGLLSWIAIIPSVIALEGSTKTRIKRLGLWISFFLVSATFYSINYHKPGHHPSLSFILSEPFTSLKYLFTMLGTSLGQSSIANHPEQVGFILFGSFISLNLYAVTRYNSVFTTKAVPWLSIGWFAVLFALVTTLGRAGFGTVQAMTPRYITPSILLVVSCLQIWQILLNTQGFWLKKNTGRIVTAYFTAGILIIFLFSTSHQAIAYGQKSRLEKTIGKTCLEVFEYLEEPFFITSQDGAATETQSNCLYYLSSNPNIIKTLFSSLEKLDFRNFDKINFVEKHNGVYGKIDLPVENNSLAILSRQEKLKVSGFLTQLNSFKNQVLFLSYDNKKSFFAYTTAVLDRDSNQLRWEVDLSLKSLPVGKTAIKAWVYDRETKQFVRLDNEILIQVM